MNHALIHGDRRISNIRWPLADVVVEFASDSANPDFVEGFAPIPDVDFSQSQEDIDAAIAQGLCDYLHGQTGEDFDAGDVRRVGAA
jgi:hypothetical protein